MVILKKAFACLLAMLVLIICSAAFVFSFAEETIELKGFEDSGEYQFIQMGYYPHNSMGLEKPILWRVLSVSDDIALLRSEYAIDIYEGDKSTSEEYVLSGIRRRALGTYLERGAVLTSSIPSEADLTSSFYGYDRKTINQMRRVEATPYIASNGALVENGYAAYWTYNGGKMSYVSPNGGIVKVKRPMKLGVVPMVTVSIERLYLNEGTGTKQDPYRSTYSERNLWFEYCMRIFFAERKRDFDRPGRGRIDVYTGPGEDYYLPNWSFVDKGARMSDVSVLAREGSWVLVEFEAPLTGKYGKKQHDKYRKTGWVYEKPDARYQGDWAFDVLPKNTVSAYASQDALLYDNRELVGQPLYILEEDREVTLFGYTEHNDILLGYVEAEIYDQKARGFVRLSQLKSDEYDFEFLTIR